MSMVLWFVLSMNERKLYINEMFGMNNAKKRKV